jgi:Cu2+-exporting ATPase
VAAGALGLAGLGAISYPVITLGALPLIAYGCFQLFKEVYLAYRNKSSLMITLFDAISVAAALLLVSPFIVASMLLVLFTSRRLIIRTERSAQADFSRIFGELSNTAWLLQNDIELEVPLNTLQVDDVIVVRAGEMVPVDGSIIEGMGMVDQQLLTGEFQPTEKKKGDAVFTSTLLLSGTLKIRVEKQGTDTITGQIAQSLENTANFKQQVQSRSDQIVEKGASRTLILCGISLPFIGLPHVLALSFSGFGYQMRAAAPLMIFNYLRLASENGVLVKDGRALDKLHSIDTLIFDKTGTLTEALPQIECLMACNNFTKQQLLQYAASIEQRQKHPIALAICAHAIKKGVELFTLKENDYAIGHGLRADLIDPETPQTSISVLIGSRRFIDSLNIKVPNGINVLQEEAGNKGHSIVYVAAEETGTLIGAIELSPLIRPEAQETIKILQTMGITTYIISGDQEKPTANMANRLGIDHYFAEVLPEEKANLVAQLQDDGHQVCFIGDGINDSVALQTADVSVSLQGAASIAQDVADIVLMTPDLLYLPYLIRMSNELNQRMNHSQILNNISGIGCVSGVFLLGMGMGGAVFLYTAGTLINVSNAMLPLLTHKGKAKNSDKKQ